MRKHDEEILEVLEAVRRWWRARCPLSWDEEKHLASPTVNCNTNSEIRMAFAIAALLNVKEIDQ